MAKNSLTEQTENEIVALSDIEIEQRIQQLTRAHMEWKTKMDLDKKVEDARLKLKGLRDVYTVPIKEIKAEIKFCHETLNDRGKEVDVGPPVSDDGYDPN